MRNAFVYLGDLSKDDVADLTRVLSRRPDYGIARPSTRWLSRQQSKIESLPKSLLRTTNLLHRLTISVAARIERLDENKDGQKILPPSAILCHTHHPLNPYLIRDILLHLANECSGDYTNALRAWPGKTPALAAFLTRIDSINAYWMSKEAFQATFGAPPHDERFVRVLSNCEACILAAIGANGRTLSDLHAWLKIRREANKKYNEDAKKRGSRRRKRSPRLHRLVEAWISHMKPDDAEAVYRGSHVLVPELRSAWSILEKAREQLRQEARQTSVHREIHLSKDGSPAEVRQRTRDGLPMPKADLEASALQSNMASLHKGLDVKSVYRADSVVDEELRPQRPGAPEPQRYSSGARSDEPPRESFIRDFEREIPSNPYATDGGYFDETYEHEFDERDPEAEARSVAAVRDWYARMAMNQTQTNLNEMEPNSIHPAFQACQDADLGRPGYAAASAVPQPLRLKKDVYTSASADCPKQACDEVGVSSPGLKNCDTKTEWTDATVYTTASASKQAGVGLGSAPPMPQIPTQYTQDHHQRPCSNDSDRKSVGNHGLKEPPSLVHSGSTHSSVRSGSRGSSPTPATAPPRQPGFGPAPPRPPQTKQDRRKYLFRDDDSDAASRLTETNRNYLRAHRGMRDVSVEDNPFVRSDSVRSQRSRGTASTPPVGSRSGSPQHFQGRGRDGDGEGDDRPRYEGYAALNAQAEAEVRARVEQQPQQWRYPEYGKEAGRGTGIPRDAQHTHGYGAPSPRGTTGLRPGAGVPDAQETEWRESWGRTELRPNDSASNVGWKNHAPAGPPPPPLPRVPPPPDPKRRPSDDVTTLGAFLKHQDR